MRMTAIAAACSLALMSAPVFATGDKDKDVRAQDKAAHEMSEAKDKTVQKTREARDEVAETTSDAADWTEEQGQELAGETRQAMDISDAEMPENLDEELADAQEQVSDAIVTLQEMRADPELRQAIDQAQGVFVVPDYAAAALVVGGSGGEGVLLPRQNGEWGNPAFYDVGSVSFGAQIGVEAGAVALLLMSDEAMESFKQANNFSLNADAGYSIIDWSGRTEASVGRGDVIAWSDTEGLFAQAAIAIADINYDEDESFAYYDQPVTPNAIFDGTIQNPHDLALNQTLTVSQDTTAATSTTVEQQDQDLTAETGDAAAWTEEQGQELANETDQAVDWTEEQGQELASETDQTADWTEEQGQELTSETDQAADWTEEQGQELASETDQTTDWTEEQGQELTSETDQTADWTEEQGQELASETDQAADWTEEQGEALTDETGQTVAATGEQDQAPADETRDETNVADAQMPQNVDEELADANEQVDKAIAALQNMRADEALSQRLDEAKGVFVVPDHAAAALIVGGSGGEGVLLPRQDGEWGNPAFYDVGSVSFGAQAGVEAGAIALLLMSDEALENFKQDASFSLDADAGYSIVNWSARAEASAGRGDVIVWSDTEGLFAQAAIAVSGINYDQDETFAYYNQPVTASAVLDGEVENPQDLELQDALAQQ